VIRHSHGLWDIFMFEIYMKYNKYSFYINLDRIVFPVQVFFFTCC
jgi:hypothetical protein